MSTLNRILTLIFVIAIIVAVIGIAGITTVGSRRATVAEFYCQQMGYISGENHSNAWTPMEYVYCTVKIPIEPTFSPWK